MSCRTLSGSGRRVDSPWVDDIERTEADDGAEKGGDDRVAGTLVLSSCERVEKARILGETRRRRATGTPTRVAVANMEKSNNRRAAFARHLMPGAYHHVIYYLGSPFKRKSMVPRIMNPGLSYTIESLFGPPSERIDIQSFLDTSCEIVPGDERVFSAEVEDECRFLLPSFESTFFLTSPQCCRYI